MSAFVTGFFFLVGIVPTIVWAWWLYSLWGHKDNVTGLFRGETINNFYITSHNTQVNADSGVVNLKGSDVTS